MIILGIDPGATTGLAVLQTRPEPCVLWCGETTDISGNAALIGQPYITSWDGQVGVSACDWHIDSTAYERVQSYGAGLAASLVDTAEIGGYCRHALGAHPITRPEVIRTLGLTGRGISKSAVWGELVRMLGSDKGGKLCPRRNRRGHDDGTVVAYSEGRDCPVCYGTGYERAPGPLAMFRGKSHAKDALAVAVAHAIRLGVWDG